MNVMSRLRMMLLPIDGPLAALSVFFGISMVLGYSCDTYGDPFVVVSDGWSALGALAIVLVTGCAAYAIASILFVALDAFKERLGDGSPERGGPKRGSPERGGLKRGSPERGGRARCAPARSSSACSSSAPAAPALAAPGLLKHAGGIFTIHPMLSCAALLAILWLPLLIASYPGLFVPGDTLNQIEQVFGISEATSQSIVLLDPAVMLNQHHPVLHTVLMGGLTWIGWAAFGSASVGFFAYILIQYLCVCASIGYGMAYLVERRASLAVRIAYVAFMALFPWFCEFAVTGTKDTLFACALLVCMVDVAKLIELGRPMRRRDYASLVAALMLLALLRKGYVLVVAVVAVVCVLAVRKERLRPALAAFGSSVLAVGLVTYGLFPALGISSGSPREMLSVPIQQVARCVSSGVELSGEQQQAIARVFELEAFEDDYDPLKSDPVKNTYDKHATGADVTAFLGVWLELLREHPATCIAASMVNYYGYFYPSVAHANNYGFEKSTESMAAAQEYPEYFDFAHSGSGFSEAVGSMLDEALRLARQVPVLWVVTTGAFWTWLLLFCMAYCRHRDRVSLVAACLPLLVLAVNLIGPCDDKIRYVYPLAFAVPFLVACLFARKRTSREG